MYEKEIEENYDELVSMLTEEEKEILENNSKADVMFMLALKYLDLKSKRRKEERLNKMTPEQRERYEEDKELQRKIESACEDVRRRRREKSEELDKMTQEERIQDYIDMTEMVEKDAIARGEKLVSIDEIKNSDNILNI